MKLVQKFFALALLCVALTTAANAYQMCYEEEYFEIIAGHTVGRTRTVCFDVEVPAPQVPSCYPSCN